MNTACSECGAATVATGQRYCHVCGALLPRGVPGAAHAPAASMPGVTTPYVVGDGSDQAMSALTRGLALEWVRSNKGRIMVYGAGAALALVAAVAFLVAAIAVVLGLVATFAPVAVVILAVYLLARSRRRRRRLTRIYRF